MNHQNSTYDSRGYYKIAYDLHNRQNYESALAVYERIINDFPTSVEAEYAKTQIESINFIVPIAKADKNAIDDILAAKEEGLTLDEYRTKREEEEVKRQLEEEKIRKKIRMEEQRKREEEEAKNPLMNCKACDKVVSKRAIACPNCGDPIAVIPNVAYTPLVTIEEPNDVGVPRCPTCRSQNVHQLNATDRVIGTAVFGIASGSLGKSFVCNTCKHRW